jgi:FkbM family methyltransferase
VAETPSFPPFKELVGRASRIKVVDVGANPIAGAPPYAPLLHAGDADLVGFEPNIEALAKLNAMKGPSETYLPYAVGDGRPHTLHICAAPGMTSLFEPDPAVLNRFHGFPAWGRVVETKTVETWRLDDVPETAAAQLLKIDIQGAELMALQHAEARLRDLLVIHSEVEFLPLYRGQPLFSDIEQYLRKRGFLFHRFYPLVSRTFSPLLVDNDIYAGLSQPLWADAIFVKELLRPSFLDDSQLLAMATILHDCYQSIDLVMSLLTTFDERRRTKLGAAYLAGLQRRRPIPAA